MRLTVNDLMRDESLDWYDETMWTICYPRTEAIRAHMMALTSKANVHNKETIYKHTRAKIS